MRRASMCLIAILSVLSLLFVSCEPAPRPPQKPLPTHVLAARDPAVRQYLMQLAAFLEAVHYHKVLAFAAAVEAAQNRPPAAPSVAHGVWDRLAQCESGGNWHINTGNGYYGGIQFSLSSWRYVGGTGYPHHHSREEQIRRGEILRSRGGWGHWPSCARKLGLL